MGKRQQIRHEREIRRLVVRYERRLTKERLAKVDQMSRDVDNLGMKLGTLMTIERFEREHSLLEDKRAEDHEQLTKLLAQIATLRGLVVFLGVPGLAALGWLILSAVGNVTATGPGGLVH